MNPNCKRCGDENTCRPHANARYSKALGDRKRWICAACGETWTEDPDPNYLRTIAPMEVVREDERMMKAMAMFAVEIPMSAIEKKLQVKGETIQKRLTNIFTAGHQHDLAEEIEKNFPNVSDADIEKLFFDFNRKKVDAQAYRKEGIRRHQIWKTLSSKKRDNIYRWVISERKSIRPFWPSRKFRPEENFAQTLVVDKGVIR